MTRFLARSLVLVLLSTVAAPAAAFDFDPVGYWAFDPDASCGDLYADLTRNGHDGTPRGTVGPGDGVCGEGSGAMSSDGSVGNYVALPATPAMQPPLPVTISAWVRSPNPARNCGTSDNSGMPIFRNDYQEDMYAGVFLYIVCTSIVAGYGDAGGGTYYDWHGLQVDPTLPADTWMHVVAVIEGYVDIVIYLDGERVRGGGYPGRGGDIAYTGSEGGIGIHDNTTTAGKEPNYAYGEIDEVAFFDRALSSDEIAELYARGMNCQSVVEPCPVLADRASFGELKARF